MSEVKEKAVLMTIDNVRIKEYDNLNVQIERYETYYNPKTKSDTQGWKFKGYYSTILNALKAIQSKEYLIDKNAASDFSGYLNEVEKSNKKLLDALNKLT